MTVSKLRKILKEETDLYKFTDDERSYDNLIDYAIDEVLKGVKNWLQGKLDELNKDDKRVYDMPTDYRAFMLEDLLTELGVEF